MILFVHGFASCGLGRKSRALRDRFGRRQVLAPDLPHAPASAMRYLRDMVATRDIDLLVGSSLGGFYATCLNATYSIPAVLVNPAVRPHQLLQPLLGSHRRYCDGHAFELTRTHIGQLAARYRPTLDAAREDYLVLLQTGDEVLDYRDAAAYYAAFDVRLVSGGNHRFEGIERHLDDIAEWRHKVRKNAQIAQSPA